MTRTDIIDAMIYRLKELPECEDVRFIREYPNMDYETPISGFLASVGISGVERLNGYLGGLACTNVRGEMYSAEGEIKIYAPKSQNGNGLSQLVFALLKALEAPEGEVCITEAKAGSIEFDTNIGAVFRRITFEMDFFEPREEE